ncbi:MAG: hypothetical protein COZ70_04250 [Deltaproteobacteria bacterium CG_4_8_14_3_um_filter_51_11]|nr:lysophospholipid acyltransferase family protein [bacterium]OIP41116.1 MAG: hypothetical protein AUK25_06275 [Desulfobacteraceae bacterium CG2_30_51_40]PIP44881.1 MAG: hypothetical protein COX16_16120 [Deltaproteobacteria bacterium CG23_combo_of_CG06-09_8_20_14_all_51_20]PIW01972.1 MAG: hypothetical protein COW41_01145 [Deltaproteobacteria bacterium CG17_big_fil_post_rev_8_21_14_2_50_51_6]PIX20329.1 MAG: hypothetical protein COZ70_04250 [Deltaproteobacteria bacterium CG_4_8_14_3_um_filter_51_
MTYKLTIPIYNMEKQSSHKSLFRWYDPPLLWGLPPLVAALIRLFMGSCRVIVTEGAERHNEALRISSGKAVYVTWHQRMAYHFYYGGFKGLSLMVSRSRDGEYAARLATNLGFRCVRGSSTLGGVEALRAMIKLTKGGHLTGMLADGPQGPARVAKIGALAIARAAGIPLIGVLWGADRCWVLNSWDRYIIPKPFAKISICYSPPVWVPQGARGEELELCRRRLEDELNKGTTWCDGFFGRERPWRKVKTSDMPEIGPI